MSKILDVAKDKFWVMKVIVILLVVITAPIIIPGFFPGPIGQLEGLTNINLHYVGRCRIDNPRATLKAGGDTLLFGYANGKDHVWGLEKAGKVIDLTAPGAVLKPYATLRIRQDLGRLEVVSTQFTDQDNEAKKLKLGIIEVSSVLEGQGLLVKPGQKAAQSQQ